MGWVEREFDVRDASEELGLQFHEAVVRRDAEAMRNLVIRDHPDILWGKYFRRLSDDDNRWVTSVLSEARNGLD